VNEGTYEPEPPFPQASRFEEDKVLYGQALAREPADPGAQQLELSADLCAALDRHARALALCPDDAEALFGHGNALMELGRPAQAIDSYERLLRLQPAFEPGLRAQARALLRLRRFEAALANLERYLSLYPNSAEAYTGRGVALFELQLLDEALASYDRAIALNPSRAVAHFHRAVALSVRGSCAEAIESYARVLEIEPEHPWVRGARAHLQLMECDWSDWERTHALTCAVAQAKPVIVPFALCAFSDSPALQLQCARTYVTRHFPPVAGAALPATRSGRRQVRVAYLSADFRDHPVSHLLTGVLERHDRQRFEITAMSLRPPQDSPFGRRVQAATDRFVEVQTQSDAQVAALIRELQIDILVDLQGHTTGARTGILAQRAAPVQVNFLGFPATMGAGYIDYIIADDVVIPPGAEDGYTEQVVRLPHCYLPFDNRQAIRGPAPARAASGLPAEGLVLCAFNNPYKITPALFGIWMRLLHRVPGSVLWLRDATPATMANLRHEAQTRGVAPERLVFAEFAPLLEDHLARLQLADLFLDTLPYNAHATAAHALWAGVPVLTCRGAGFASRVGASLLRAVGLPQLITEDLSHYESQGMQLVSSPHELTRVRTTLQRNRDSCALFDTDRFREDLERAYVMMRQRAEAGAPPLGFSLVPSR